MTSRDPAATESATTRQRVTDWFAARSLWIGAVAVALPPIGNVLLTGANGATRWGITVVLVLVAILGFAIPAAKAAQAEADARDAALAAVAAGANMRMTLADGLLPVLSYVVRGADDPDPGRRRELSAEALTMVLASAARLCDPDGGRARACWYELTGNSEADFELVPRRHFGRGTEPTTAFGHRTQRGLDLLTLLREERTELWADLSRRKPANWQPGSRRFGSSGYGTFLVVPVRSADELFGLITVDAEEPGTLSADHVAMVQVFCWILALALSHRNAA